MRPPNSLRDSRVRRRPALTVVNTAPSSVSPAQQGIPGARSAPASAAGTTLRATSRLPMQVAPAARPQQSMPSQAAPGVPHSLARRLPWFLFSLILIIAVCSFALTGCAPKPPKPVKARAQLVVSADVNPDSAGRASPVVVRLFQLRNDGEFAAADFFALYEKEKETLGASLITREEYVLAPGETRTLEMPINAEARFVGALAAYRDIRSSHWRALTRTPEKKLTDLLGKHGLTLSVGKDTVTLAVED